MTEDHDCAVVGEMLLRRAFHLNSADPNLDAVNTLVRIRDTQLPAGDEPETDLADREAFTMVRDRVVELLGQDLVDWVGQLSPETYRIDSYHPARRDRRARDRTRRRRRLPRVVGAKASTRCRSEVRVAPVNSGAGG